MKDTKNILFIGIGGYGIITASDICAHAALYSGFDVKQSAIKGIAQRGGYVISHIRFGTKVYSPRIEPGSADFVINIGAKPDEFISKNCIVINIRGRDIARYGQSVNIYALGLLSCHLPFHEDSWLRAIEEKFGIEKDNNLNAFFDGQRVCLSRHKKL